MEREFFLLSDNVDRLCYIEVLRQVHDADSAAAERRVVDTLEPYDVDRLEDMARYAYVQHKRNCVAHEEYWELTKHVARYLRCRYHLVRLRLGLAGRAASVRCLVRYVVA